MAGRYTEYPNVIDFVEYKLHNIINDLAAIGRDDIAEECLAALDMYLTGEIDIWFQDGQAYYTPRDTATLVTKENKTDNEP